MPPEILFAFKEWAVVVGALGSGRQSLILRKGGIHEQGGKFRPEHKYFFLLPTWEHQRREDLKSESHKHLARLDKNPPHDNDPTPIAFFAHVEDVFHVTSEAQLEKIEAEHIWTTIGALKKFQLGTKKGLYVLLVRVFQLPSPFMLRPDKSYGSCRSWVALNESILTEGGKAVLGDDAFLEVRQRILKGLGE